ncbi:hypothetical protein GGI35DRAFT_187463 [Trichoderma velutinum]
MAVASMGFATDFLDLESQPRFSMAWTAQLRAAMIVGLPDSSSANASRFCLMPVLGFSEYFGHGTVRHGTHCLPTLDMQSSVAIASLCPPGRHASRARIHWLRELINLTDAGVVACAQSAICHIRRTAMFRPSGIICWLLTVCTKHVARCMLVR